MRELFSLSFYSPSPGELWAFPLHAGVIVAVCGQAGAPLLGKEFVGQRSQGLVFERVLSAQAAGWPDTLFIFLVLCPETPCAAANLCAGGQQLPGQGELLCSTKTFTCLRNFALGMNYDHAAFSLISCC